MANQISWQDVKFAVGDSVRVHQSFAEGDKTRLQIFEGLVIAIRGHAGLKSFVVRRIASNNIGVEKIFPLESPTVTRIEVKKKGNVRRAKLYYLRGRVGKRATKVKGLFVKGASESAAGGTVIVKKSAGQSPEREEQPAKNKVAQTAKPERVRKVKKGPKKIVRKERIFVR